MVLAQEVLVTLNLTGEVEIADVAVEVGVVARTLRKKSISWDGVSIHGISIYRTRFWLLLR